MVFKMIIFLSFLFFPSLYIHARNCVRLLPTSVRHRKRTGNQLSRWLILQNLILWKISISAVFGFYYISRYWLNFSMAAWCREFYETKSKHRKLHGCTQLKLINQWICYQFLPSSFSSSLYLYIHTCMSIVQLLIHHYPFYFFSFSIWKKGMGSLKIETIQEGAARDTFGILSHIPAHSQVSLPIIFLK